MSTYTTKQGDMWDTIALSQYGTIRQAAGAIATGGSRGIPEQLDGVQLHPRYILERGRGVDYDVSILSFSRRR